MWFIIILLEYSAVQLGVHEIIRVGENIIQITPWFEFELNCIFLFLLGKFQCSTCSDI